MKCNKCGFDNPDNSTFCSQCGNSLNENFSSVQPQPQYQQPYMPVQPQKKKRKGCLITLIIVGVIFIGIIALASGGDDTETSSGGSSVASSVNSSVNSTSSMKEISVIDFSSMTAEEIETWGNENGVECIVSDDYSDDVEKGKFISQSVDAGDSVYEGDSIYVYFSLGKKPSIEYLNALAKAKTYSDIMYMSKQGIYDQLVSEYGEKFDADAAQYAIDHLEVDYKINALEKAKVYRDTMNMSKNAIYDQLISEYGEKFTEEEAQYAIDHLDD